MENIKTFKTEIVCIPATKQLKEISRAVYYNILIQVPKGKVIRDKEINEYLCSMYECEDFTFVEPLFNLEYVSWAMAIREKIPFWRKVSNYGMIVNGCDAHKKLEEEGLLFNPCGKSGKMVQVQNYKQILFNPAKEMCATKEELELVVPNEHYLNLLLKKA